MQIIKYIHVQVTLSHVGTTSKILQAWGKKVTCKCNYNIRISMKKQHQCFAFSPTPPPGSPAPPITPYMQYLCTRLRSFLLHYTYMYMYTYMYTCTRTCVHVAQIIRNTTIDYSTCNFCATQHSYIYSTATLPNTATLCCSRRYDSPFWAWPIQLLF